MKRTFMLIVTLALLLLAAALAPVLKSDPGLVLINFRDWTIETSLLVLIGALLLLWIAVHYLVRLWRLPAETARRVREQRALAQLEKGLLARSLRELGHWDELQALFPALRRAGVLTEDQQEDLQVQIAVHRLRSCDDAEALEAAWKRLPRAMKKVPAVVEIFAEQAGRLERADLAEPVLRASLKSAWNSALVLRYGDPGAGNASQRLKQCEKWLQLHPDDASLHLALGRLCAGEEIWGKAREHLIRSLELDPSSSGYEALGQLLERQGDLELAMACFRNALRLNQDQQALPLPGGQARLGPPDDGGEASMPVYP